MVELTEPFRLKTAAQKKAERKIERQFQKWLKTYQQYRVQGDILTEANIETLRKMFFTNPESFIEMAMRDEAEKSLKARFNTGKPEDQKGGDDIPF